MAAITTPLAVAGIVFFLCIAALFQDAEYEAGEIKMTCRFLLGPVGLAVLILVLAGVADHLYFIWQL
jgi:hypothetical protein